MNDFLQSIRNGQAEKHHTAKTRKNYDNSYHHSNQRFYSYGGGHQNNRNPYAKRQQSSYQGPSNNNSVDESTINLLANVIENTGNQIKDLLAKNHENMLSAQAKTADMMERHMTAVEKIMDSLSIFLEQKSELSKVSESEEIVKAHADASLKSETESSGKAEKVARGENNKKDSRRYKIINIVQKMRAEGATFDQIAKRLNDLGHPTFSGRGEWHAQTTHRICKK